MAINGNLITDESKYKTEIVEIPSVQTGSGSVQQQQHHHHHNNNNQNDNNEANSNMASRKRYSLASSSMFSIAAENLRTSYYDTITNLTIDDISMQMQGQLVECFAYSFLSLNSNQYYRNYGVVTNGPESNKKINLNTFQNNVMNTKSNIQVDCMLFYLLIKIYIHKLKFY